MNIEDEEMNFLPAGSKIDVFKIEKIKDLKNITEAGDVKGQPKIFKVDSTFMKYNIAHLQQQFRKQANTAKGTKLDHPDPQQRPILVAGSKIGLDMLFRKKSNKPQRKINKHDIPTAHQFWESASKSNGKKEVGVSELTKGWDRFVHDMHKQCGWEGKYSMDQIDAMASTLATIECSSQSPHHDYHLQSGADEGDENTIIMPLSKKGTFLVLWIENRMTKELVPVIVWIAYGLAFKFGKKMLHAGGLGAASSLEEFTRQPYRGFPRLHIYVVAKASYLPTNYICYGDPENDGLSYNNRLRSPHTVDILRICNEIWEELSEEKKRRENFSIPSIPVLMKKIKGNFEGGV